MTIFTKKLQQRQRERRRTLSSLLCYAAVVTTVAMRSSPSSTHYYEAEAFTLLRRQSHPTVLAKPTHHSLFSSVGANQQQDTINVDETDNDNDDFSPAVVRAPLKFIGPYPCLALRFPNLATESQRSQNKTGISLDFVLDTAANINTLQGQVAQELKLETLRDSPALPGVSSAGPMGGGETYVLGDSELERPAVVVGDNGNDRPNNNNNNNNNNEPFEFMQNLTAAVIPVANPGSAGLLGLAFFYCFEGGVEFRWGPPPLATMGQQQQQQQGNNEPTLVDGMVVEPALENDSSPSITFYGQDDAATESVLSELSRVPIDPILLTQLPSVKIRVNGVEMVALLDTGSPITVLNQQAAEAAGIQTTKESMAASEASGNESSKGGGGWNPFASVVDKFKEAQATVEAASRGDILMIGGIDGKPTTLYRSDGAAGPSIALVGNPDGGDVPLIGTDDNHANRVYVGDIPGLAALNGIGVDSPPAVVLGLDLLRQRPKMVFRPRENALYI